jgi:hypothetical protein
MFEFPSPQHVLNINIKEIVRFIKTLEILYKLKLGLIVPRASFYDGKQIIFHATIR